MDKEIKRKVYCSGQSKRVKEIGNRVIFYFLSSFLLLLVSCNLFKVKEEKSKIVARVYDQELSFEEIKGIVPKNISKTDSLDLINRYIKSWISKQLLLKDAEQKADYNEAEVERKILDYKYALIVFEYQKQFVSENLDTAITQNEIEEYYTKNIDNFELKQNIIKGMFVKVPIKAPRIDKIKSLLQAKNKDYKSIHSYCYRFADNYVLEDTVWNNFDEIIVNSPFNNIPDKVQFLKKTHYSEISDAGYTYILKINDYKIVDQNSPLEFVKPQIINIILNKRKVELIQKLERDTYNKALNNKDFEIFTDNN